MSVRLPFALAAVSLAVLPLAPAAAPTLPPTPPPHAVLGTYVRGAEKLTAGAPAALRIATHWASSETETGAWPGVDVEVTLKGGGKEKQLWRGRTDGGGVAEARFDVPAWPDGRYSLPKLKVAVEPDRAWYRPGDTVKLAVEGRYFFGKAVAGGAVTIRTRLQSGGRADVLATLHGKLDADGKTRLELTLP